MLTSLVRVCASGKLILLTRNPGTDAVWRPESHSHRGFSPVDQGEPSPSETVSTAITYLTNPFNRALRSIVMCPLSYGFAA
jgi:hypothetical protein